MVKNLSDRFCKVVVLKVSPMLDMGSQGLFRGVADNAMRLGVCSRSDDVIEPMIKPQWYGL